MSSQLNEVELLDSAAPTAPTAPTAPVAPKVPADRPTPVTIFPPPATLGPSTTTAPPIVFEEPWNDVLEQHFKALLSDLELYEILNSEAGRYHKKREHRWTVPSILIPALAAPLLPVVAVATRDLQFILSPTDILALIVNMTVVYLVTIREYYKFDDRALAHFEAAATLGTIASDLDMILIRGRAERTPAAVCLKEFHLRIRSVTYPEIPMCILNKHNVSDRKPRTGVKLEVLVV